MSAHTLTDAPTIVNGARAMQIATAKQRLHEAIGRDDDRAAMALIMSLITLHSRWEAAECPLCQAKNPDEGESIASWEDSRSPAFEGLTLKLANVKQRLHAAIERDEDRAAMALITSWVSLKSHYAMTHCPLCQTARKEEITHGLGS